MSLSPRYRRREALFPHLHPSKVAPGFDRPGRRMDRGPGFSGSLWPHVLFLLYLPERPGRAWQVSGWALPSTSVRSNEENSLICPAHALNAGAIIAVSAAASACWRLSHSSTPTHSPSPARARRALKNPARGRPAPPPPPGTLPETPPGGKDPRGNTPPQALVPTSHSFPAALITEGTALRPRPYPRRHLWAGPCKPPPLG